MAATPGVGAGVRTGAFAVLCVNHGPRCEGHDRDVRVVSVDRLPAALRVAAATVQRPAFLVRRPAHSAGGQGAVRTPPKASQAPNP
jgi:hypothetical protein